MEEKRLLNEQWFGRDAKGELFLKGVRCTVCGKTQFPPSDLCTLCYAEAQMEEIKLSKRGRLFTYTVSYIAPPGYTPPYAFGYVDLPEGIRLFTQLSSAGAVGEDFVVGQEMEMVIGTVKRDANGELVGYKFTPVKGEEG